VQPVMPHSSALYTFQSIQVLVKVRYNTFAKTRRSLFCLQRLHLRHVIIIGPWPFKRHIEQEVAKKTGHPVEQIKSPEDLGYYSRSFRKLHMRLAGSKSTTIIILE
jgi:predicted phosphatase